MTLKLAWFFLLSINNYISSEKLVIINSPELNVFIESTQSISWENPLNSDSVKIDLYKSDSYLQTIYKVNKSINYFNWVVPDNSIIGDRYLLHITVYYNKTKSISNNTSSFNILKGTNKSKIYFIIIVAGVGIILTALIIYSCNRFSKKYLPNGITTPIFNKFSPKRQPIAACTPPQTSPIMIQRPPQNNRQELSVEQLPQIQHREVYKPSYRDVGSTLSNSDDITEKLLTPHVTKDDIDYYY